MTTILRTTGAFFLGAVMAGGAIASPAMESAVRDTAWTGASAVSAEADPGVSELLDGVQLVSDCCDVCDDPCDACVGCGDGCDCGSVCGCPPVWYGSAGVILLKRDRPAPGTVVAANPAGTPFSSASDFAFDWDLGVDVAVARRFSGGTILEARYFGVDSVDTNTFVTPGNFIGAGFTGPVGTNFSGKYLTMLDSSEINLRRAVNDRLSLLGGFRWVELKDEMFYKLNGNVATGDYEFNNRLYGGQVGASLNLTRPASRVMANIDSKVGMYGNVSDGGIFEFQGNNFIGSFVDQHTTSAFVGEIGLTLGYRLTKHVVLRGGYQLLWLDNVALAGDGASRSLLNPSLLRDIDYGHLFYQGATTGLDFAW